MQYICGMPMAYQFRSGHFSFGLWKIEEDAAYFEQKIAFVSSASHPERQRQQCAARMVLETLHPNFPFDRVVLAQSGKPMLPDNALHFSLSHCSGFAACIVSKTGSVGIDVEAIAPRVLKIEQKFLHDQEMRWLEQVDHQDRVAYATLLWSIKETVFKWWGSSGVDFSKHICVQKIDDASLGMAKVDFFGQGNKQLEVQFFRMENIWLSFMHMAPLE